MMSLFRALPGVLALGLLAVPAQAKRIAAPPPIALRAAQADAVFVARISEIDAKPKAGLVDAADGREMHLAKAVVSGDLLGHVGKNIEVAFQPGGSRFGGAPLAKGDEVLFFARKHPDRKNTYVADMFEAYVSSRDNASFKAQVTEAKEAAALLANPMKALKSKDAAERGLAAFLLVTRYKTPVAGSMKTEAVPAEESKLILEALADGDWKGGGRGGYQMNPQNAFHMLGATAGDGWTPPRDFTKFQDEAKKWLKESAGKFKMTRYARPEMGKPVEP
jgi:hypothetical protein